MSSFDTTDQPRSRRGLFIALGLGVVLLFLLSLSYVASQIIAQQRATVVALVPKHPVAPGTVIRDPESLFERRTIPLRESPPNMVPAEWLEKLKGCRMRHVGPQVGQMP